MQRRTIGLALLGIGAFCAVAAVAVRLFLVPQLVVLPLDQDGSSVATGSGVTVFYPGDLEQRSGVTLRAGRVMVANALGTGVLESAAWLGFLPPIAERLIGEKLLLPEVATWWLGEKPALDYVLANLDRLVIKPAYPNQRFEPMFGRDFTGIEREQLVARLKNRPYAYVAQEHVRLSQAPVWKSAASTELASRALTMRNRRSDGHSQPVLLRSFGCSSATRLIPRGLGLAGARLLMSRQAHVFCDLAAQFLEARFNDVSEKRIGRDRARHFNPVRLGQQVRCARHDVALLCRNMSTVVHEVSRGSRFERRAHRPVARTSPGFVAGCTAAGSHRLNFNRPPAWDVFRKARKTVARPAARSGSRRTKARPSTSARRRRRPCGTTPP